jgi:hypothetical protein
MITGGKTMKSITATFLLVGFLMLSGCLSEQVLETIKLTPVPLSQTPTQKIDPTITHTARSTVTWAPPLTVYVRPTATSKKFCIGEKWL